MTKRFLLLVAGLMVSVDLGGAAPRVGVERMSAEQAHQHNVSARRKRTSGLTILNREGKPWGGERDSDFHVAPLVAPGGHLLVAARDTLYMLSSKRKVLWKYYVGAPVLDKLILDSTGMIHGIAMDGISFGVDLEGNRRWADRLNGRANYSQIALYGRDQYLVVVDYSGYRESLSDNTLEDRVALCRGQETIWSQDFPRKAELYVYSGKIFAITQTRKRTALVELHRPATAGNKR